jgi:hypothetical protein
VATFRTEHSELAGDLQTRMVDFLSPLVGLRLNELGECSAIGRMPLWWRVREGAYWEFGHTAKVSFPDPCSIVLRCGRTEALIP